MKKLLEIYHTQDKVIFISLVFSLAVVLILAVLIFLSLSHLPKKVPLFYSLPWGESQLVNSSQLFILPALIVLVGLVNLFISMSLHNSQMTLKRTLHLATSSFSFLLLVTALKIIFIFL